MCKLSHFTNNILINHEIAQRNGEEPSTDKVKRLINLMNKVYILLYDEERTKKYIVQYNNSEKEYKPQQLYNQKVNL